jgi:hypothetical protein
MTAYVFAALMLTGPVLAIAVALLVPAPRRR